MRLDRGITEIDNNSEHALLHSTDMCILAFKEAILKYCDLSSNVYTCFLDASKAFDRVNHFKLFTTLSKRNVDVYPNSNILVYFADYVCTLEQYYVNWL